MGKVNRAKVIAAAHKYLSKGDLKRAIREYDKVLREDPSDIRTKLKVADLLFRMGEKDRATAAFEDVAEFYASQGFLLKAVAVFKQVLKLKPNDVDIHLSLANLYQQIGLVNDAIGQYREAITLQDEQGLALDRLKTAQKMLELDPDNARLRVALAEDFSREGMIEEAVHEFRSAADILKAAGMMDEYVEVSERLLYHQPDDFDVNRELAAYYAGRQDALKALTRLQVCFKDRPNDPEVLDLLGQVFEFSGQPQKAVAVLKSLAHVYDRTGLIRERDEVFKRILNLSPGDKSAQAALQFMPPEEVESGVELEFESSPASVREEIQVDDDLEMDIDEIEIDAIEEDTSPEVQLPQTDSSSPADSEPSIPIPLEGEEDKTIVAPTLIGEDGEEQVSAVMEHLKKTGEYDTPTPTPLGVDLTLVPPDFQDDIQNLEFLIDVGLKEDAEELLEDIRKRAGELPILARYEALVRG
ncbi:MAG: tetratricopeptide repeat protein [Deltaproteobacteria bacterium]|nr:tetratricopeptide repeat protein [Deltaproteobacteria bacterium]